ncbi:MAG: glycosyltransferase family 2 protein [Symploca sp. SIO2E6]|nr:glycosyltransferase family 2 protein [Symploca sp. SIO2E6]
MLSKFQENTQHSSEQSHENNSAPLVSFGLPVYNASEPYLRQLLDSLLAQSIEDLEVVISDNASDNGTQEICEEYASRDPRVRYHRNPENIGQVDNFNQVLKLAQGKYFRWIGSDDWLEPDYASRCVEALEAQKDKDFVGVSTYYDFTLDEQQRHYQEYQGERLDSPLPSVRFRRMVWFMTADFGFIDPIYTMISREALLRTNLLQHIPNMDQVLAVELSLLGPFTHVPACLAHRRWENFFKKTSKEKRLQQYSPKQHQNLKKSAFYVSQAFLSAAWAAPISNREKMLCLLPVARFTVIRLWKKRYRQFRMMTGSVKSFLLGNRE